MNLSKTRCILTCATLIISLGARTQSPVITSSQPEPYDITKYVYSGPSQEFSIASEELSPEDITFNDNGSKMFIIGYSGDVVSYTLNTPYQPSTASYDGVEMEFRVTDWMTTPRGIAFNNDGSKMFIAGSSSSVVVEFDLNTAYIPSTATYVQELSLAAQEHTPYNLSFDPFGSKMFIIGYDHAIAEYNLAVNYDISTAVHTGEEDELSITENISSPRSLLFNGDGTKLFITGTEASRFIYEYNLQAAYDVSTATLGEKLFIGNEDTFSKSMVFNADGSKMFMVGSTDDAVVEYNLSQSIDVLENSTSVTNIDANDGVGGALDENVSYSLAGLDATHFNIDNEGLVNFISSPNFEEPADLDHNNSYLVQVVVTNFQDEQSFLNLAVNVTNVEDRPIFTTSGQSLKRDSAIYASEFSVEEIPSNTETMAFNTEGTRLFIASHSTVSEYYLTEPFHISTAVFDSRLRVGEQESDVTDITFSTDGLLLFVIGDDQRVVEYILDESFDISTAQYNGKEFHVGPQQIDPTSVAFSTDGTKMFITGSNPVAWVHEYHLATPFDISTAELAPDFEYYSVSSQASNPLDMMFNPEGTQMYILGGSRAVYKYNLYTAFDVSTAEYAGVKENIYLGDQELRPRGMTFGKGISQLFIIESDGDKVVEYAFSLSKKYPENSDENVLDIDAHDGIGGLTDGVTYSLEGDDASNFTIDENGVIRFSVSPDYENPEDSNGDNVYEVVVVASNLTDQSYQYLNIIVEDNSDSPIFISVGQGFDVSSAVYAGSNQKLYVGAEEASPNGIAFSNDGLKLFVTGSSRDDRIVEYDLDNAYDISSARYAGHEEEFFIDNPLTDGAPGVFIPGDLIFSADGHHFFVLETWHNNFFAYDLSIPYDISTAVLGGYSSTTTNTTDITFSHDGTKLFQDGTNNGDINERRFRIGFEISTSVFPVTYFNVGFNSFDLEFNEDGTRMLLMTGEAIKQYELATAFDLSTIKYLGEERDLQLGGEFIETPSDFIFSKNGTKMYVVDPEAGELVEYALASSISYPENSSAIVMDIDANDGIGGAPDVSVEYRMEGIDASLFSLDESGIIAFITVPDFENPIDQDADNVYQLTIVADNGVHQSSQDIEVSVKNVEDTPLFTHVGQGTFDVSQAIPVIDETTYVDDDLDYYWGATFNHDGTKLFLESTTDLVDWEVNSFILTNPYNLSMAQFEGTTEIPLNSDFFLISDLTFSRDGTCMFLPSLLLNDPIKVYSLGTSFDLSTAEYQGESPLRGTGLAFNADGSVVYLASDNFHEIWKYTLDEPYNIISAIRAEGEEYDFSNQANGAMNLWFNSDGTRMLILGTGNVISQYQLTTPYEASTATYLEGKDFDMGHLDQLNAIFGSLEFNENGTMMFVLNSPGPIKYRLPSMVEYLEVSSSELTDPETLLSEVIDIEAHDGMGGSNDFNVNYSLQGVDSDLFTIDESGSIVFSQDPDFENPMDEDGDNTYLLTVVINNSFNQAYQDIEVVVKDLLDEDPPNIFSTDNKSVKENTMEEVYLASANEPVTFSLGDSKDENRFSLSDHQISFISPPDHENPQDKNEDNQYVIDLIATDNSGNISMLEVTITVTDVIDEVAPEITSDDEVTVEENIKGVIYLAEADETVTFALGESKDESIFDLSGDQLSFFSSPDYENPLDENEDNIYLIDLLAIDETGNTSTLSVSIAVTDIDDTAPLLTSSNELEVPENISGIIYTVTTDEPATLSLGKSKDEALFDLSGGQLSFLSSPDHENPQDENEDNQYIIDLIAIDGSGNVGKKEIIIRVTDIEENALGIGIARNQKVFVYPNPTSSSFQLPNSTLHEIKSITLLTTSGRVIKRFTTTDQQTFDTSNLYNGYYILVIERKDFSSQYGELLINHDK